MKINVLEYFETGALITNPEKTAIKDEFREISFKELNHNSDKLGTFIAEKISHNNALVAVYLPKSIEIIISNLSIVKAGNFYTNLDAKSPIDRLQKLLNNITPDLIITNSQLIEILLQLEIDKSKIICIDTFVFNEMRVDTQLLLDYRSAVLDTDPLCLINTSGSTGTPKSVVLNHRSTIDFVDWCFTNFEFESSDSIGNLSPLYFDIYTLELFICLNKASTLILIPENRASFPAQLAQFISDEKITFIFWVPTIMVNIANQGLLDNFDFSNLRRIFFAGEVFSTKHLNIWRKALPSAQFVNLYGPIEITIDCTYFIVNRDFQDSEPIPIGIPCRNSGVFILTEDECLADIGQVGEICVRGTSLALGYYNNPDQTSKVFTQNPLNKNYPELIYRTGDLGYVNEHGEFMFSGRRDYQIKHLGYRIELAEIETAILSLKDVKNACVVYNKEKKEIILIFESENDFDSKLLRSMLSASLPKYMLPTSFFKVDKLPRNPNGKIDRQKLYLEYANNNQKI